MRLIEDVAELAPLATKKGYKISHVNDVRLFGTNDEPIKNPNGGPHFSVVGAMRFLEGLPDR